MKNKTKYIICLALMFVSIILLPISISITEKFSNFWWTIMLSLILFVTMFVLICIIYTKHTEFICPKCNAQFKPKAFSTIMAMHTLTRRHLICPQCNKISWCKEKFIEK